MVCCLLLCLVRMISQSLNEMVGPGLVQVKLVGWAGPVQAKLWGGAGPVQAKPAPKVSSVSPPVCLPLAVLSTSLALFLNWIFCSPFFP